MQVCVNISLQDFGRKLTDQVVNPKRREVRFVSRPRIDASEASLAAPLLPSPLLVIIISDKTGSRPPSLRSLEACEEMNEINIRCRRQSFYFCHREAFQDDSNPRPPFTLAGKR